MQARKSPNCSYHIYVASALMEWSQNNDLIVARKVFEIGLKKFITEPKVIFQISFHHYHQYVMEYLKFLQHQNDKDNIRVLFERVVVAMSKEKALEIWNEFLDFEYENGNLDSISNIIKRRTEIYPELEISDYQLLINRFKFHDLYPEYSHSDNIKIENLLPKSSNFVKPGL
jgi:cleavage stimulation factor subunit 3